MILSLVEVKLACGQCRWRVWCGTASAVLKGVDEVVLMGGADQYVAGGISWQPRER